MFTMSHKQCPMLFQDQKPHPKPHDKVPQRLKCHQDIPPLKGQNPNTITWYVPFLACSLSAPWGTGPPTSSRIYLSPQWATGDNASYNTSFACGLLALLSLAYTLKDLLLPPMGSREWCVVQYPFAWGLLPYMQWPYVHIQGFTCVMQSVSLQLDLLSPRQSNHQHHSTRAKPHQKLTSSMYSKYIVYFQVVS